MKQKKRIIFLSTICVALLIATSILGTIAYLIDEESVLNTFSVGDVDIKLDETVVNKDGEAVDEDGNVITNEDDYMKTEDGNDYLLIPGREYIKDPQVTILAGSQKAYVRMILVVDNKANELQKIIENHTEIEDYTDFFDGWIEDTWVYQTFEYDESNSRIAFEFRYYDIKNNINYVDASELTEDIKLPPLFTELVVPELISSEEIKTLYEFDDDNKVIKDESIQLVIYAQAIQADNIEPSDELTAEDVAWDNFKLQKEL